MEPLNMITFPLFSSIIGCKDLFDKSIIFNKVCMKQLQLSDRQSSFIFYLVHQGKGRTEAARLAGFAAPRQSAFTLTQSPKIIAKIRQERNKVYQTELASTAVQTLKEVMEDTDAPASARIAAARTSVVIWNDLEQDGIVVWWRWGESNPRLTKFPFRHLQV